MAHSRDCRSLDGLPCDCARLDPRDAYDEEKQNMIDLLAMSEQAIKDRDETIATLTTALEKITRVTTKYGTHDALATVQCLATDAIATTKRGRE